LQDVVSLMVAGKSEIDDFSTAKNVDGQKLPIFGRRGSLPLWQRKR
jgi:hypothetical protein